jgi:hypothetical protein
MLPGGTVLTLPDTDKGPFVPCGAPDAGGNGTLDINGIQSKFKFDHNQNSWSLHSNGNANSKRNQATQVEDCAPNYSRPPIGRNPSATTKN